MKKIILSVSSVIIILFLIEIFFYLFYPQSGYSVTFCRWGWKHIPNTTVSFYGEHPKFQWNLKLRPRAVKIKYNNKGLRGRGNYNYHKNMGGWNKPVWKLWGDYRICKVIPVPLNLSYIRILLLGDSWLEDMGSVTLNLVDTYLAKRIRFDERGVKVRHCHVINAGHYGYDNAQEYMWYVNEGYKYNPDIVLVFFAQDSAEPENATLENGKVKFHYRTFTLKQKAYRSIVSFIRRHSHFGSWILNNMHRIPRLKDYLIKEKMKEKDIKITNYHTPNLTNDFKKIDKRIYLKLKEKVEADGGILVMIKCMGEWKNRHKDFLEKHDFYYMSIKANRATGDRLKNKEIEDGTYDPFYNSHRFGYRQNSVVSEEIYDYLKKEGLI